MRIGIIAPPWLTVPPARYGGTEMAVNTLAVALAAAGHDIVLAAASDSSCAVTLLEGYPRSNFAALGKSAEELRHVTHAYRDLVDVDVIHDNTVIGPHLRRRPSGVPVVTTQHGPFTPTTTEICLAMPADVAIVAISRHHASTADGVPIARVIHHGIDAGTVPVGSGSGGYACFLGRMSPDKGVTDAIAVARMAGVPLRIAAKMYETPELEYFESAVRPLLGSSVEFLGELSRQEKFDLLGGAVATLNPLQWNEPFGVVMIESLAAGTPIIATSRGSVPEIIDDGVTGFIRDSIAGLAEALGGADALDRAACRASVEGRFSARRMAQEYSALFSERIAAQHAARP